MTPFLIAHRGSSHAAPENTLAAFRLALAERAGGLELDVRMSSDDEPIIFHDADLQRLTTQTGPVASLPWSILRDLTIGQGGDTIPHLADLVDLLAEAPRLLLNVELKPLVQPQRLIARARPHLERLAALADLVISSFDPRILAQLAANPLTAPFRLALLFDDLTALSALRFLPDVDLHPMSSLLTQDSWAAWARPGRRFRVWTVDDPTEARRLLALSPDIALITNRPGPLLAELSNT